MRSHMPLLDSLRRLVETGDGPLIHAVDASKLKDEFKDSARDAEVVAIILEPSWYDGYINTRAKLLAGEYGGEGRLVALLGVKSSRLSPEVRALAKWVLY